MSTFGGKIEEIPYISVDRFDGENLKSDVYFLSHCHSDHMNGINLDFGDHLIESNKFIYATKISCIILSRMFPRCAKNLKELCIHTPETINEKLSVTSIPAGHCPGSVMFLFVTDSKRILYTGDYRINKNDIRKIKAFYNSFKQVLTIDKIYLDTTFFLKSYLQFPKREDSVKEVCRIIETHLNSDNDMVWIKGGAKYAYEYVFQEIYKKFKLPVHVNEIDYNFYKLIPELDFSVTTDGSKTPIHYNCDGYHRICNLACHTNLLVLFITAMRWKTHQLENGISYYDRAYHVCFSTHASFEEGEELIKFLRPKEIEICVDPKVEKDKEEISNSIKNLLNEIHPAQELSHGQDLFKTYVKRKRKKRKWVTQYRENTFDLLSSPPRENRFSDTLSGTENTEEIKSSSNTVINISLPSPSKIGKTQTVSEVLKSNNLSLDDLKIESQSDSKILLNIIEGNHCNVDGNVTVYEESSTVDKFEENVILKLINSDKHEVDCESIHVDRESTPKNVLMDIIDCDP